MEPALQDERARVCALLGVIPGAPWCGLAPACGDVLERTLTLGLRNGGEIAGVVWVWTDSPREIRLARADVVIDWADGQRRKVGAVRPAAVPWGDVLHLVPIPYATGR